MKSEVPVIGAANTLGRAVNQAHAFFADKLFLPGTICVAKTFSISAPHPPVHHLAPWMEELVQNLRDRLPKNIFIAHDANNTKELAFGINVVWNECNVPFYMSHLLKIGSLDGTQLDRFYNFSPLRENWTIESIREKMDAYKQAVEKLRSAQKELEVFCGMENWNGLV